MRLVDLGACAVLMLLIVAAYANALAVPFQYDDNAVIVDNAALRDWSHPLRILSFGEPARPMVNLSLALNYQVHGLSPRGYHIVNIALHAANAFLLYAVVRLLLLRRLISGLSHAAHPLFGFLVAAIFALHPVNTESVTYIWGRTGALCALFYLAALLFFIMAQSRTGPVYSKWYWASLVSFTLAIASKSTALSLPLLLILVDALFLSSVPLLQSRSASLARHGPFLIIALVRVIIEQRDSLAKRLGLPRPDGGEPLFKIYDPWPEGLNFWTNSWTQFENLGRTLKTLVFPLHLNVDHDVSLALSPIDAGVLIGVSLAVAGIVIIGWGWRREPWLSLALAWIGVTSVLFFLVPLRDLFVERRLYLPSAGFAIGAAWILCRGTAWTVAPEREVTFSRLRVILGSVVLAAALWATVERNEIWATPERLWRDAIEKSPLKDRPLINLSVVKLRSNEFAEALVLADKALTLNPGSGPALLNRIDAYRGLNAEQETIDAFSLALQTHAAHATVWLFKHYNYLGVSEAGFRALIEDLSTKAAQIDAEVGLALGLINIYLLNNEKTGRQLLNESAKRLSDTPVLANFHRPPLRDVLRNIQTTATANPPRSA